MPSRSKNRRNRRRKADVKSKPARDDDGNGGDASLANNLSADDNATSTAPSDGASVEKTSTTSTSSVNTAVHSNAKPRQDKKPEEPCQGEEPTNFNVDLSLPFRGSFAEHGTQQPAGGSSWGSSRDLSRDMVDVPSPGAGHLLKGPIPPGVKGPLPPAPPGTFPTPTKGPLPLPSKGPAPSLLEGSDPPSFSKEFSQPRLAQSNNNRSHIPPGYLNQPQGFAPIPAQRGPPFQRPSQSTYSIASARKIPSGDKMSSDLPRAAYPGSEGPAPPPVRRTRNGVQSVSPDFYRGEQHRNLRTLMVYFNMQSSKRITLDANYDMDMKRLDNIRTACRVWIDPPEGSEIKWLVLRAERRSHLQDAIAKLKELTKIDEDEFFAKCAYLLDPPAPGSGHFMILKSIGPDLWRGVAEPVPEPIPDLIDFDADEAQATEKQHSENLASLGGMGDIQTSISETQTASASATTGVDKSQDEEDLLSFPSDSSSYGNDGTVKPSRNDERRADVADAAGASKTTDKVGIEGLVSFHSVPFTKASDGIADFLRLREPQTDAPAEANADNAVTTQAADEKQDAEAEKLSFFCGPFRQEFEDIVKSFRRDPDGLHMRVHFGILTLTERPRTPDSWNVEEYKALLQKVGSRATVKFEESLGTAATAKGLIDTICSRPDKFEALFATDLKIEDVLPKHYLMVTNVDWLLELELEILPAKKGKKAQARVCQTRAYRVREKERHTEIRVSCPQKKCDWKLEVMREAQTQNIPKELLEFRDTIRFGSVVDERCFPKPIFDPKTAKAKKIEGVVGKTVWTYLVSGASCRLEVCLNNHCRGLDPALSPAVTCSVSAYGTWWDDELMPCNIILKPRDFGAEHQKLFPTFTDRHGFDVFGDCVEYIQGIIDEAPEVGQAST